MNKSLSEHFKPAIVLARRKAYAYDPLAAGEYNAESMPTLHHNGIKKQQLIVFKTLKNRFLCLLMRHNGFTIAEKAYKLHPMHQKRTKITTDDSI